MNCPNCTTLKARIALLEAELARVRGDVVDSQVFEESSNSSDSKKEPGTLYKIRSDVFGNPQLSPSDIKNVDFRKVERLFKTLEWDQFVDDFITWAQANTIKAVAFIICYGKQVKESKGVKAVLLKITQLNDERLVKNLVHRCVFELYSIKISQLTDEELEMCRKVISEYVEEAAFADEESADILDLTIDQLTLYVTSQGEECNLSRTWDLLQRAIWPLFPENSGILQEKLAEAIRMLVKQLSDKFIRNELLRNIIIKHSH